MDKQKNILFIIADDLGKYVGSYGCRSASTPNIDNFAKTAVQFDLAFASTASCSGSRSVIYTGLHTHENGQYGLIQDSTPYFRTFNFVDSAPKLFNEAGYLTGIIGKVHVGDNDTYPWTVRDDEPRRDPVWFEKRTKSFFDRAKSGNQPFHLTVGFIDPHRDQTRGGFGNDLEFDPQTEMLGIIPEQVEVPAWLTDNPGTRTELADYYRAIYRFDQGVGRILKQLKEHGLEDSTMVIVTSDNGPPFMNAKTTLYDAGTCLPFIVRIPGGQTGISNPNLVSYIDIVPTWLDWASISLDTKHNPKSPTRLGRSILPIVDRQDVVPESEWQHHIFCSHTFHQRENYYPTRVIRHRKWKYHRNIQWRLDFPFATDLYASLSWEDSRNGAKPVKIGLRSLKDYLFRPDETLYDMENDPHEINNLAADPRYAEIKADLLGRLEAWQLKTDDLWLWRDGQSVTWMKKWVMEDIMIPDAFDIDVEEPGTDPSRVKLMKAGGSTFSFYGIEKKKQVVA